MVEKENSLGFGNLEGERKEKWCSEEDLKGG
jgi:hypothetical protein